MADEFEEPEHRQKYPVNGVEVDFPASVITGRDALTRSDHVPASEYQLILVHEGRTRLIGTDDEINLLREKGGELRAFESDRDFGFAVDEVGQVWGMADMEVDEFLHIWPAPAEHHWALEQVDEPDTILTPGGVLSFGPRGVEHIVSRPTTCPDTVLVMVVTTAGVYPAEGAKRYPAVTPICEVLNDAKLKLGITTDPSGWVVTVAAKDVNPNLTFQQAGLSGSVKIEWGPAEGGGGA